MSKRVNLSLWNYEGDLVKLSYVDGTVLYVRKSDFNEHFGFIVNVDKDSVMRSFAVKQEGVSL